MALLPLRFVQVLGGVAVKGGPVQMWDGKTPIANLDTATRSVIFTSGEELPLERLAKWIRCEGIATSPVTKPPVK